MYIKLSAIGAKTIYSNPKLLLNVNVFFLSLKFAFYAVTSIPVNKKNKLKNI